MKFSKKLSLILIFSISFLAAGHSQLLESDSLQNKQKFLHQQSITADSKDGSLSKQDVWVLDYLKDKKRESYNYLLGHFNLAVERTKKTEISPEEVLLLEEKNGELQTQNNQGEILMVTWNKKRFYTEKIVKLDRVTWLTAIPEVSRFCNETSGIGGLSDLSREMMLDLRLTQYLGLIPEREPQDEKSYDSFVEIWVKKENLTRPCSDGSIYTNKCSKIDPEKLEKMRKELFASSPKDYPFTGLGYTYDWGFTGYDYAYDWGKVPYVGASEFVIKASKEKPVEVKVHSVTSTKDYCKNNKIPAPE